MATDHYKAVIIGAGQSGKPLSVALAQVGWKTALVERGYIGGTCINVGCTPTKTMIASARIAYLTRRSADYGVHAGSVTVNMAEVRARKQAMVDRFRTSGEKQIVKTDGLDWLQGEAHFTAPHELEVNLNDGGTRTLSADYIFIDTGGQPATLPIPGIDQVNALNSTTIMELDELPEHLMIIGGGYIGLEFGQMFCRFGSQVTIVDHSDKLVSHEDDDVADEVANILREDGIEILFNVDVTRVSQSDGRVTVGIKSPDGERTLTGSHLLLAVGRAPNTDALNLDAAGIKINKKGYVQVNERLETNVKDVYALGDVNGGPAFTHISYDDFRIIRANLLDGGNRTTADRFTPYVTYIDPELGRVGLSERQAREAGRNIRVAKLLMSHVARADEMDETRGFMKAIVDADTHQILGATILGVHGGELAAAIQIAMMGKLPYTALRDGVFSHPTLTESLNNLFSSFEE